jgi:hypothetical protein
MNFWLNKITWTVPPRLTIIILSRMRKKLQNFWTKKLLSIAIKYRQKLKRTKKKMPLIKCWTKRDKKLINTNYFRLCNPTLTSKLNRCKNCWSQIQTENGRYYCRVLVVVLTLLANKIILKLKDNRQQKFLIFRLMLLMKTFHPTQASPGNRQNDRCLIYFINYLTQWTITHSIAPLLVAHFPWVKF